eukprot:TRINITY_DN5687_c0_g1_i1.p1 TRINITY_DN5687_c0_g1~~TRINITY_DN5687_c0_g1_i1.p1  ORF type:complete len:123 (+),score=13.98 TRINITY_DN5687_c0_g1_i1:26-394(+)
MEQIDQITYSWKQNEEHHSFLKSYPEEGRYLGEREQHFLAWACRALQRIELLCKNSEEKNCRCAGVSANYGEHFERLGKVLTGFCIVETFDCSNPVSETMIDQCWGLYYGKSPQPDLTAITA